MSWLARKSGPLIGFPFSSDFEAGVSGWGVSAVGTPPTLTQSSTFSHSGAFSGKLTTVTVADNEGYYCLLPRQLGRDLTIMVDIWVRKNIDTASLGVRLCDAALAGYAAALSYGGNLLYNAVYSSRSSVGTLVSASVNPAATTWYRLRIIVEPTRCKTQIYNTTGALLAETAYITNLTYSALDRIFIVSSSIADTTYWDDLIVTLS